MFSNPEKNILQFGIGSGMKVADFGAGNGYYAKILADRVGKDGIVYCIDISKDMLRKLVREASTSGIENIETIVGDLEKEQGSTLLSDSVDAVVIANTFFQIENKASVSKEAFRILHPKGSVLVVEWADSFAGIGPHRDHVVPKELARKMFEDAGFVFEREIEAGMHHYGLVMRKV